jgi:hypothetical protein
MPTLCLKYNKVHQPVLKVMGRVTKNLHLLKLHFKKFCHTKTVSGRAILITDLNSAWKNIWGTQNILKLSTLCMLALSHFFLLQLNAQNMLNAYIYHHLPPACFGVCYTIVRETIALLAQKLYPFCIVVVKYTVKDFNKHF